MIDVTIKTLDSQNHAFSLNDDTTVAQFKEKIFEVINIPVDTQRLIYCGRVLQDNKKLQEYDVHGKVVHLVQRAPPSSSRRTRSPPPTNTTRRPFPGFNGSANAMYLGSMAFPSGLMEAQGIVPPPPTQSLSGSRLNVAKRMLRRAENILNHLEDPQASRNRESPPEEPQDEVTPVIAAQVFVPESTTDDPLASLSAAVSAVENDILQRENGDASTADAEMTEATPPAAASSSAADVQPADTTSSSSSSTETNAASSSTSAEQVSSTSADAPANGAAPRPSVSVTGSGRLPENSSGTIEMARLLDELNTVQTRLRPFMERYHAFMRNDPAVSSDQVPTARETQMLINRVSEVMHLLGHAYHSLSDVMVQVSAPPPRPLLCRPILIQHSAVLQAGIPIQVEAQINLTSDRRPTDANTNAQQPPPQAQQPASGEQQPATSDGGGAAPTPDVPHAPHPTLHLRPRVHEIHFDSFPIEVREIPRPPILNLGDLHSRRPTQPAATSAATTTTSAPSTDRTQTATSTDQNARPHFDGINPSNMEFFMEVTPESITIDSLGAAVVAPGPPGENVVRGTFASAPPELIHSILQAVAGQMVGVATGPPPQQQASSTTPQQPSSNTAAAATATTTTTTPTPTTTGADTSTADATQPCTVSQTSSSANGTNVNSQARGNTQTHPTTATQTRSTSRPHVHLAQHTMQGFDPFLPCNSHHIRHRRRAAPPSNPTTATATASAEPNAGEQQQNAQLQNPVYNLLQGLLRTISTATRQQQGREQQTQQPESQQTPTSGASTPRRTAQSASQASSTTLPPFSTFLSSNMDFRQLQSRLLGHRTTFHDITLATLLNYLPEYTEGEGIFNDLITALAAELTFGDVVALNNGNFECVNRIRPTLRTFFADRVLQGENPTQEAIARAADRLINELQPTLEIMNTMRVRDNIDIVESMSRLCRSRFLLIISSIMSQGSPTNLMDQCILTIRQLCMLALHCSENGQPGVEEVLKSFITRYTMDVSQDIQQWTVNAALSQFREFMGSLDVPTANITPFIVTRSTSENNLESNDTPTSPEPEAMECEEMVVSEAVMEPLATPLIDQEAVPNVLIDSEPWHQELPAAWIPIITRDSQRQRRQNPQPPFSDAYLSGMPSKRRKVVSNNKPQGTIRQVVSDGVRRAVSTSGLATAVPLDVVTQAASNDTTLHVAYRDFLRATILPGVTNNPDFTPERFPNLANYFDIKKD